MNADDAGAGSPKVPRTEMSGYGGLLFPGQGPVLLAGFGLIAVGAVCLYLSDAVAHGWLQGTLDAFGVGFIVGGLVDVLAISGLTQIVQAENKRRQAEQERAAREQQKAQDMRAARNKQRAEEFLARLPRGDVDQKLRRLRNDEEDPDERAAVLQRLPWQERYALMHRLEELDAEQYEVLWPLVYRVRP